MRRVLLVARREFLATAATPGFLIGVLVTPLLLGALMLVLPRLMRQAPPDVSGEVALIDPTGRTAAGLRAYLSPERVAARHAGVVAQIQQAVPGGLASSPGAQEALESSLGGAPRLTIAALDPAVDDAARLRCRAQRALQISVEETRAARAVPGRLFRPVTDSQLDRWVEMTAGTAPAGKCNDTRGGTR